MKKYRWVLTAVFAAFLVGTSGCGKKTETIPITTISQSTDDDDPEDNLAPPAVPMRFRNTMWISRRT